MNEEKLNNLTREEAIYYLDNQMDYTYQLQQENQQLKERINTYENPEDLTLMFMYCDEKAKDKIKLYKSVLDEIREKIDFAKATIEYGGDCSDVDYNFLISADKIVEILDKAGKQ